MSIGQRICLVTYWLGLTLWVAAIAGAGAAAAFTFRTLPSLGVTLRDYAAFDPGDPLAHGRLAAGMILEPLFTTSDFLQLACCAVVLVSLVLLVTLFGPMPRRPANLVRLACLLIASGILVHHVMSRAPDMNRELRAYWDAARAGDEDAAANHHEAFQRLHPAADRALTANLFILLVAVGASALVGIVDRARPSVTLEEPRLRPAR